MELNLLKILKHKNELLEPKVSITFESKLLDKNRIYGNFV